MGTVEMMKATQTRSYWLLWFATPNIVLGLDDRHALCCNQSHFYTWDSLPATVVLLLGPFPLAAQTHLHTLVLSCICAVWSKWGWRCCCLFLVAMYITHPYLGTVGALLGFFSGQHYWIYSWYYLQWYYIILMPWSKQNQSIFSAKVSALIWNTDRLL